MHHSLPSCLIKLRSHKLQLRTNFLSSFASELNFETGAERLELKRELEVTSEPIIIESKSQQAEPFAIAVVVVEGFHVRVLVQAASILVHFSL